MADTLECERCGAALPAQAARAPVQCHYCGSTSVPVPRVVEKVVERLVVVQSSETGTGPSVACPRCGNAFAERRTGQHVVRACGTCGGVFLEPAAFAALEQTRVDAVLRTAATLLGILMPFPLQARAALSCPFCQKPLLRRHLGETGHSIDTCAQHGTFFDRGELVVFTDFCQARRAER